MLNKQEIKRMVDNLVREGMTQGEAYMKVRRLMVRRLTYAKKGSAAEDRILQEIDLLDALFLSR